jgi:hypothetical protein
MAYASVRWPAGVGLAGGNGDHRRLTLTWPRLTAPAELGIVLAGYFGYALVRLAVRASHTAAFEHAAQLWQAERWLHLDTEVLLNDLLMTHPALAQLTGYYYGLLHFIVTPLTLAWLYLRRPAVFPRLRSALVLTTAAANLVFWTWPVAPPRFAVPGMTDVLSQYHILGAGKPHGPDSMVNMYAAMPSLHVAWAAWCAVAVVIATRSRWRHLAWLYPLATTFVVLASANHFVLDAAAGAAITALGLLATRGTAARTPIPAKRVQRAGVLDRRGIYHAAQPELSSRSGGAVLAGAPARPPVFANRHVMAVGTLDESHRPEPRSRSP